MSVSFVPAEYTSQRCNNCGYISKRNRTSQESFKCCECGHIDNADNNSSKNILSIIQSNVLIERFLKFDPVYKEYNVNPRLNKKIIFNTYQSLID